MNKLILATPIVLTILGCAPMSQQLWQKDGSTQSDFSRDRYACLQQSQQRASSAYVNAYAGQSASGSITNGGLFDACMNASGWYLRTVISKAAIPSNYVYDKKTVEKNLDICAANNATSDEIGVCMQRINGSANNL